MEPKTNYEAIEQKVLSETEIDKNENNEVPMFIQLPEPKLNTGSIQAVWKSNNRLCDRL
jgi:hypothetical protein